MDRIKSGAVRSVFTVKEKKFLTPHYIRIVFGMTAQQAELFSNVGIGAHNKIFIPAPGTNQVVFPDEGNAPEHGLSVKRTYTTRHIDYAGKELWVDFVAHGDNGPASYWAQRAAAGSVLGIGMKDHKRPLFPVADDYLFVGDSTAIPVIGAMLAQLPEGVTAKAVLEVPGKEDEMDLFSKAGLSMQWVHNPHPAEGSRLAETVLGQALPVGRRFVFVAAEYSTVKQLKDHFKNELGWPPEAYSAVSYWTRGASEEQSAEQRQQARRS